jgi:glycosyltransferase involved in cell wall biosynthesis
MKSAFITDWLEKYGGAERVVTAINEIYKFDYYYAYVNKMDKATQVLTFGGRDVSVIESKILSLFKYKFRIFLPFFPSIVKAFNNQTKENRVDLVISSSWALSKGYRVGNEIHVSYLQARNFKYVWDESDLYFKGIVKAFSFLKHTLQQFDLKSAQNPDYLISNSHFVKKWVKDKYGRESIVIYPPVEVEDFGISDEKGDYFIIVGRIEQYKRFDIVINAFNENGKKLIVIGDGTQLNYLKSLAKENIEFLGFQKKDIIKTYLSKSRAFVYAGVEDFGIALVEAHASGVPVIAYQGGAAIEIISESNGLCYEKQTSEALNQAIVEFVKREKIYNKELIRSSSFKFSKARFQLEFKQYVDSIVSIKKK